MDITGGPAERRNAAGISGACRRSGWNAKPASWRKVYSERSGCKEPTQMPEIPDVEVYRRNLVALLVGKEVSDVLVHRPKRSPPVETLNATFVGAHLSGIDRAGKELVLRFDNGHSLG